MHVAWPLHAVSKTKLEQDTVQVSSEVDHSQLVMRVHSVSLTASEHVVAQKAVQREDITPVEVGVKCKCQDEEAGS